jgi:predicted site-specific integrase-resolvase
MVAARLLTAAELAQRLQVTPGTIKEWARAGVIPRIAPTPKTLRFDPEAVARRLAERSATHTIRPADQPNQPENLLNENGAGPS